MNKLKVFVVGGNRSYASFLDDIEIVNDIEEAQVVIFTGGEDVTPDMYDEDKIPETFCNPLRDDEEFRIFNSLDEDKLCVGICRGAQFLCVANGGKLVQHVDHHGIYGTHPIIRADNGSECLDFADAMKFDITSTHHQMMYPYNMESYDYTIMYVANGLSKVYKGGGIDVNMIHDNGEPEIVYFHTDEHPRCLAIQGHPEIMDRNSPIVKYLNVIIHTLAGSDAVNYVDFKYRHDYTEFSSKSPDPNYCLNNITGPCFGSLFKKQLDVKNKFNQLAKITYSINVTKAEKYSGSSRNCCFYNKETIDFYYKKLQECFDFKYKIKDDDEKFIIEVFINGTTLMHKTIITYLRYIYQWPMNFILHDALALAHMEQYKDMNILDLITIVTKTNWGNLPASNEYSPLALYISGSTNLIIKKFNKDEYHRAADEFCRTHEINLVNEFYRTLVIPTPEDFQTINEYLYSTSCFAILVKSFPERLHNFYINNIKLFNEKC